MSMQKETLIKKCDRAKDLQKQIDELGYELDSIKEELKNELDERKVEELVVGPYNITYKTVVSNRFDGKSFKEKYGSLYESFTVSSSSRRFQIK